MLAIGNEYCVFGCSTFRLKSRRRKHPTGFVMADCAVFLCASDVDSTTAGCDWMDDGVGHEYASWLATPPGDFRGNHNALKGEGMC